MLRRLSTRSFLVATALALGLAALPGCIAPSGGGGGGGGGGFGAFGDSGLLGADTHADDAASLEAAANTDALAAAANTDAAASSDVATIADTQDIADAKPGQDTGTVSDTKTDTKADAVVTVDVVPDSGPDVCKPLSCQALGAECGTLFNGCTEIDCGTCASGKVCGSGLQAHKCVCAPKTCGNLGVTCGKHPDGCGGQVDCGKCPECSPTCPAGWSCGDDGACQNGTATNLALHVQTRAVGGTILVDGKAPVLTGNCGTTSTSMVGTVTLTEKTQGYSFTFTVSCKSAWSQGFAWSGKVFPGVYEVRSGGEPYYANLPSGLQKVIGSLDLQSNDKTDVALDIQTRAVGGTLLVDGKAPALTGNCSSTSTSIVGTVTLTEKSLGYSFSFTVSCKDSWSKGFSWSGKVFPGVYEVRAGGEPYYANLPSGLQKVIGSLDLQSYGKTDIVLDIQTRAVGGTILVDGKAPVLTGNCSTTSTSMVGSVTLTEKTQGYSFTFTVSCKDAWNKGFAWSGKVFPGVYEVRAGGEPYYANLPSGLQKVIGTLDLQSYGKTDMVLDIQTRAVGGTILVDGKAPVLSGNCSSTSTSMVGTVTLTEKDQGYAFSFTVSCKDAWSKGFTWSGKVFPGVYEVRAGGEPYYANLPSGLQKVIGTIDLQSYGKTDISLDIQTRAVGGSILVDGKSPVLTGNCSSTSTSTVGTVTLTEKTQGYSFTFTVSCKNAWSQGFAWSGKVFPGVYEVRAGGEPYYANLPSGLQKVIGNLDLQSYGKTDVVVDVQTRAVGGTILVDGKAPVLTGNCGSTSTSMVGTVTLTEKTQGYAFTCTVSCKDAWNKGFAWSGKVFPGVYEVRAGGEPYYANLPSGLQVVIGKLAVL